MIKKNITYFYKKAIKIPMYGGYFLIIFSNDGERIAKTVSCNDLLVYIYAHSFNNFIYNGRESFAVAFNFWDPKSKISIGTITHEVTHAGNSVLQAREIVPDYDNDEAEAYLKGWMGDEVEKFMNECKLIK